MEDDDETITENASVRTVSEAFERRGLIVSSLRTTTVGDFFGALNCTVPGDISPGVQEGSWLAYLAPP